MTDEIGRTARAGLISGDLAPLAKWARAQDDKTGFILAELIEQGGLKLVGAKARSKAYHDFVVGNWIAVRVKDGTPIELAIEDATMEERFKGLSKRTARRAWDVWRAMGVPPDEQGVRGKFADPDDIASALCFLTPVEWRD